MNDEYMIKCDDCKVVMSYTKDILESYAGGICENCKAASRAQVEGLFQP